MMPRKPPRLAKLSRPRLHKAVIRERLLELLDEKREHPAVWIAGPPGSGKTTLAASYIEEANATAVWFQIDAGDSDPATFFYYLKQAVEQTTPRRSGALQLFTPEYLSDIEGFARRFFRDALLRLPDGVLLVFDNYHELEPQSPLHSGFAAALSEIPLGANVLVLSRSGPPSAFAQAVINQVIARISWEELKLTSKEAQAVAAVRGITDSDSIHQLQEQSDGWVAGMTLMLERSVSGGTFLQAARPEMLETVADYFALVIFEKATAAAQQTMLHTALLPYMTPTLVEAITSKQDSIDHIRVLHRRHLFVNRIPSRQDTYQYHTMFHSFLRSRSRASLTDQDIRDIRERAARAFEEADDPEGAFMMLAAAENWERAEHILINQAGTLITQGRWRTIQQWAKSMPEDRVAKNPWIRYWLGRSSLWVDQAISRQHLEAAHDSFVQSRNQTGQVLAASGITEAILMECDFSKFEDLDSWIERVSRHIKAGVPFPSSEDELQVLSTLAQACNARMPNHPMLLKCLDRIEKTASNSKDPNLIVMAAGALLAHVYLNPDEQTISVVERISAPALHTPEVTPLNVGLYLASLGYAYYTLTNYHRAFACYDRADTIADQHGLIKISQRTAYLRTVCARRAGMAELAEQSAQQFASLCEHHSVAGNRSLAWLKAAIAYDRHEYEKAAEYAHVIEKDLVLEGEYVGSMLLRIVAANIFSAAAKSVEAKRLLAIARRNAIGPNTSHFLGSIALNEAWAEHLEGNEEDRDKHLREALEWAHDKRGRLRYHWFKNALEDLLSVAIDRDVDPEMARQLARDLNIQPRDNAPEQWPWKVKVWTLGTFQLHIDGQAPSYTRKLPKKALALLKAVIAFGGENVAEQKLTDALWPDAEGDAAQRALGATVHRLRKLLAYPGAVRHGGGALTLDDKVCWVDAFAFEQRIAGNGEPSNLECALQLYQGSFLPGETDSPWLAPFREHLKSKFIDAVGKLGAHFEENHQFTEAIALYSRGIEADNLIESFYQSLMRCHEQLGQPNEALSTYRRLRDLLSITLGVVPSSRSRQMADELRAQ